MRLWTDAIEENGYFDSRYTCDLDNSSPELRWDGEPDGTAGYVLIAEHMDSDGKAFAHWVVYNIPAGVHHLPTGIPPQDSLPNGIRQGLNGFNKLGYYGPCPPRGSSPHHFTFRLYALKQLPEIASRLTRDQLIERIRDRVLATAEIHGRYQRLIERAG